MGQNTEEQRKSGLRKIYSLDLGTGPEDTFGVAQEEGLPPSAPPIKANRENENIVGT